MRGEGLIVDSVLRVDRPGSTRPSVHSYYLPAMARSRFSHFCGKVTLNSRAYPIDAGPLGVILGRPRAVSRDPLAREFRECSLE
ncbi:hypothetical protein N7468_008447 [Penicillium chermesinum]|uniref:Uncharacterized protein n=1 Tax=Penicillium chermesinum TaxID=63820 RepID=A0A9W9NPW2_9EURO|nr:uncharacterized protein N7468_008447 [Penicillium chermesinum]KAJ5223905.1 hypothetical protein N7468_008447 [Penicillium chermesinum]